MKNIEILAPVGGEEQLIAAVRSGADAVYFGAASFNARRNAVNFTDDDFIGAVKYCHERNCKVYVTLNTLCSDREVSELATLASFISEAGADAVLVNTAIAVSGTPVQMAAAFKLAVQAGRMAYEAKLASPVTHAVASSPLTSFLDE